MSNDQLLLKKRHDIIGVVNKGFGMRKIQTVASCVTLSKLFILL
jgi:hypothetical protein